MILRINGEPTEFEAYSLGYDNDLLDGVLLDMPETYIWYSFLSKKLPIHLEHSYDILNNNIEYFAAGDMINL